MEDHFWRLTKPPTPKKFAEWDHGKVELERIKCPANVGHQRGGKRLSDLRVVLKKGPVEDFVWTWYSELLLQDHTLRLLRSAGFTGFEVKPVLARYEKSAEKPPKLWELVRTGWAGMASPASGIRLDEAGSCEVCGLLHYTKLLNPGRLIAEELWDGSDFFMVWPWPMAVFVTDKVVQFIEKNRLTGTQFEGLSDMKTQAYGFGPGRLSYHMPENRAREIGELLGIY